MTIKLILDRYEDDLGVCLDFEHNKHYISKNVLGNLKVNDIFNIEFDDENYHSPSLLVEETEATKERISQRMRKIYNMGRHRRPPKL